jgi:DNA modification methylase
MLSHYEQLNQIIEGHALKVLQTLPDNCIDLCFTSPPYFNLRTYTTYDDPHELGRERYLDDYLNSLIEIFREVKRVLKPSGACFVNLGDVYNGDKRGNTNGRKDQASTIGAQKEGLTSSNERVSKIRQPGIQENSLLLIPQRFQIYMVDKLGFCAKNHIIWNKPNAMPNGKVRRWATSHESIGFFVKNSGEYYFNLQYEDYLQQTNQGKKDHARYVTGELVGPLFEGKNELHGYESNIYSGNQYRPSLKGRRHARDMWTVNTQGRKDSHFATFPDELPRRAILAACPRFICKHCGFIRETEYDKKVVTETTARPSLNTGNNKSGTQVDPNSKLYNNSNYSIVNISTNRKRQHIVRIPTGKLTSCSCSAGWRPGIVLDPFCGRGTTCIMARNLGRDFIGIDLNVELAKQNLSELVLQSNLISFLA